MFYGFTMLQIVMLYIKFSIFAYRIQYDRKQSKESSVDIWNTGRSDYATKFTANILKKMHMAYAVHAVVHLSGAQSSFKI